MHLLHVAPNVYFIPGKNKSRFPYSSGLYIKGKEMRVLIDAGMGAEQVIAIKQMGLDLLLLSHCHLDHRLFWYEIQEIPVWCHEQEAGYMRDPLEFFTQVGLVRGGVNLTRLSGLAEGLFPIPVSRYLTDGQEIDMGGMHLIALYTPGHTPGHFSFFIPEHGLLFTADIDLTFFGPFYGHDFSSIEAFISSIEALKSVGAGKVVTGHAGPFETDISERFDTYAEVVYKREKKIMDLLDHPRSVESLRGLNVIYPSYPAGDDLNFWFELVHIEKHLERLRLAGKITCEETLWRRL